MEQGRSDSIASARGQIRATEAMLANVKKQRDHRRLWAGEMAAEAVRWQGILDRQRARLHELEGGGGCG